MDWVGLNGCWSKLARVGGAGSDVVELDQLNPVFKSLLAPPSSGSVGVDPKTGCSGTTGSGAGGVGNGFVCAGSTDSVGTGEGSG